MKSVYALFALAALFTSSSLYAHDTWVQTNTNVVRTGDVVHVDLMLGNHGNDHRDFKLASKIDPAQGTLDILAPDAKKYDLAPSLVDTGYMPQEGFWTARFVTGKPGLYTVAHTLNSQYQTTRTIKSGKTYFLASNSLDEVEVDESNVSQPLGHPFEIVPLTHPVTPLGPGQTIKVQLLYQGEPAANTRVSFIPRSVTLAEGFDERYERMTDAQGVASFEPNQGDYLLIAAHHTAEDQQGEGYDRTKYSATLVLYVPHVCPCCQE